MKTARMWWRWKVSCCGKVVCPVSKPKSKRKGIGVVA